jgi:integrase
LQEYRIQRFQGKFAVIWEEDGKRRRFRLAAQSRKEAEAEARDVIIKEKSVTHGITVADIWGEYRREKAGRTIAVSMDFTGRSILPFFGHFRTDQITSVDCKQYIAERRAAGRADGTIWTQMNHLRIALGWAAKMNMIERAPYVERPPQPKPRERFLTHNEIAQLIEVDCAFHVRLAILIMLTTAARVGAVLDLTWSKVDFERSQVDFRAGPGPRKGRAVVPMNRALQEALRTARQAALTDHVIEWAGKPVGSIKKGFNQAVKLAGLTEVSPHVLRHTAAVHMVEAGVSMDEVSQFLGHSNTSITASVYARYSPQHLRKAANALEFGIAKVQ